MNTPTSFVPAYLSSGVPVILISLADQTARRQVLVKRGVPCDWVEAFFSASDQRQTQIECLLNAEVSGELKSRYGSTLLSAEIGCAMSHRAASRWLARSCHQMALVLEDDVLPSAEDWLERTSLAATALMRYARCGGAFVCLLGARNDQVAGALTRRVAWRGLPLPLDTPELFLHTDPDRGLWRAHAYLISRAAAERTIREELKIRTLADDWKERRRLGLIDELFYTRPGFIGQDENQSSTIDPEGRRRLEVVTERTDLRRPIGMAGKLMSRAMASIVYRTKMAVARINSRRPYILR